MFTRPADLADEAVAAVVESRWGADAGPIEHVPRGFGSHHWRIGDRWFVTIDDLRVVPPAVLTAALDTARWLRDDAGLAWVVAPEPSAAGRVIEVLDGRWGVALYRWVDGEAHDWGPYPDRAARLAVVERLAELHSVAVDAVVPVDDLAVVGRSDVFADLDRSWARAGPYGEPGRRLLADAEPDLRQAFARYDALVDGRRTEPLVVSHGEPHIGNTMTTAGGVVLIDWDTVRAAQPERDLWSLALEDPGVLDEYEAHTGRRPDADALELHRLRWDLTDVALFAGDFRARHDANADTDVAWPGFQRAVAAVLARPSLAPQPRNSVTPPG